MKKIVKSLLKSIKNSKNVFFTYSYYSMHSFLNKIHRYIAFTLSTIALYVNFLFLNIIFWPFSYTREFYYSPLVNTFIDVGTGMWALVLVIFLMYIIWMIVGIILSFLVKGVFFSKNKLRTIFRTYQKYLQIKIASQNPTSLDKSFWEDNHPHNTFALLLFNIQNILLINTSITFIYAIIFLYGLVWWWFIVSSLCCICLIFITRFVKKHFVLTNTIQIFLERYTQYLQFLYFQCVWKNFSSNHDHYTTNNIPLFFSLQTLYWILSITTAFSVVFFIQTLLFLSMILEADLSISLMITSLVIFTTYSIIAILTKTNVIQTFKIVDAFETDVIQQCNNTNNKISFKKHYFVEQT